MKSLLFSLLLVVSTLHGPVVAADEGESQVLITNVTLIDGTGQAPQRGVDILVAGERIAAIGKGLKADSDALRLSGLGKYVIPGLIDTHVHLDAPMVFQLSAEEKQAIINHTPTAFLYNGVTSVLNVSSKAEWIWDLRKRQRAGYLIAPRIYALGHSLSPEDGWGSRHGGALGSAEQARALIMDYVAAGTDGLKVIIEDGLGAGSGAYREMPEDILATIVSTAEANKLPLYVHAIGLPEFHRAARIKPRAIIHGLEDKLPAADTLIAELVANNIAVVPTLSLFAAFSGADPQAGKGLDDPVLVGSVPAFLLQNMRQPAYMQVESERFTKVARMNAYQWAQQANPIFCENVGLMHRAGVKIAVGTDAGGPVGYNYQGYNTPWEIKLLSQCGLSPMQALVAATRNGAEVLGVAEELGTVEKGKLADLLILASNPLDNIDNIRDIRWVMQNGSLHRRADFAYKN